MYNTTRFVIDVRCPINGAIQSVEMVYTTLPDATRVYAPCNGCDNCHGADLCKQCRVALTLMFHHGYEHTVGEIVKPDFSELK